MKFVTLFSVIIFFVALYNYIITSFANYNSKTVDKVKRNANEFKNILVVTMSEPTLFMLQRAVNYQLFKSVDFDVWYIFDISKELQIPSNLSKYFRTNVYRFNSSDYLIKYPNISDLYVNCIRSRIFKKEEDYRFIAYMTLAERVNELYHQNGLKTKYLWVIEQDSAITGNLTKFFNHFDYFDEDFICRGMYILTRKYTRNYSTPYKLSQCLTNKLKDYLENKTIYFGNIFFSRFSSKYMSYLNEFLKNGYHGNSEMIYPAVAYLNHLTFMSFPDKYIYKKSSSYSFFKRTDYESIKDKEYLIHKLKE